MRSSQPHLGECHAPKVTESPIVCIGRLFGCACLIFAAESIANDNRNKKTIAWLIYFWSLINLPIGTCGPRFSPCSKYPAVGAAVPLACQSWIRRWCTRRMLFSLSETFPFYAFRNKKKNSQKYFGTKICAYKE